MKNDIRIFVVSLGCMMAVSLICLSPAARAEDLPDPLKLRAECAAPEPKRDPLDLDIPTPEQLVARSQAVQRQSVAAAVIIEITDCDRPDCVPATNGTGTVVSEDGLVLTAYHVVDDAVTVRVVFRAIDADGYIVRTGRVVKGKVVVFSKKKDVALLRLEADGQPFPHLAIECQWQAGYRSPLWHFGQKSGRAHGLVTYKTTSSVNIEGVYETDAPAKLGDSGAPFVRSTGSLVGILLSINGGGKSYYMPAADAISALEGEAAK